MSEFKINRTKEKWGLWPVWKVALQVGEDDNASRLWIVEKTMRIGSARVRFGGIAGVGTKKEHRMKGYASVVLDASTELMQERGYDMGMLFGIRNFYHRFGYGVAFPIPRLFVKTENLLRAKCVLKARAMKKTDGAAIPNILANLCVDVTKNINFDIACKPHINFRCCERCIGQDEGNEQIIRCASSCNNGHGAICAEFVNGNLACIYEINISVFININLIC